MKLFVARLPQSATSESLKSLFEPLGKVTEAKVIMDRETGMSKGYGFVEMSTAEEAQNAIHKLNGYEIDGKDIMVKSSDPAPSNTNEKKSFSKPTGDRWNQQDREDRNKFSSRNDHRDRTNNQWDEGKNLRPRRKRI